MPVIANCLISEQIDGIEPKHAQKLAFINLYVKIWNCICRNLNEVIKTFSFFLLINKDILIMKVGSMQDYFVLARQILNVTVMLNNTGKSPHLKYAALFAFYQS